MTSKLGPDSWQLVYRLNVTRFHSKLLHFNLELMDVMLTLSGFVGSAFNVQVDGIQSSASVFYEVESEQQDEHRKVWVT
ncbi:hypothetical protein ACT8ZS_07500 [Paenibacillus sp. M.A.Huq-84]